VRAHRQQSARHGHPDRSQATTAGAADTFPAVELRGVSKHFGGVVALDDVSLTVGPGRFLTLLGPSGSGKSTLIRCLAGIEHVSAGAIALAGSVVADTDRQLPPERRDLAMVFQDFALWPHMTAAQNVAFALRRRRTRGAQATRMAVAMLARVGLDGLRERYPHELSGGEQQRVALARALVAQPDLLLFDEPLSSLDANLRELLRIEIGTLVREAGASAVYITHDQGEAFALGDEVGVLERGRLVQCATPEDIYNRPATAFVARFTGLAGELHGRMLAPAVARTSLAARDERRPEQRDAASGADRDRMTVNILVPAAGDTRVSEVLATPMVPLAPGQATQVLVRPSAIRLTAPDDPLADLRGTIVDSAFRGRGYDHVVGLPDGELLTEIFARERHRRGGAVGLRVDPQGCLAFPADPAAPRRVHAPLAPGSVGADQASPGVLAGTSPQTAAAREDSPASVAKSMEVDMNRSPA
jgi:iron(III) transport system ATP-binding protein